MQKTTVTIPLKQQESATILAGLTIFNLLLGFIITNGYVILRIILLLYLFKAVVF